MNKSLFGEILVKRGCLKQEQLDCALDAQKKQGGCVIGDILLKQGLVSEQDLLVALMVQCGLPYIAVNKYMIEPQMLTLIPKDIAHREKLLPFNRIGNVLSVAMASPLSQATRKTLEKMTSCRLAVFVSTKSEIETAIARLY